MNQHEHFVGHHCKYFRISPAANLHLLSQLNWKRKQQIRHSEISFFIPLYSVNIHPSIYSTAFPGASHRDSSPDFPHLPASPVGHQVISKSAKRCNLFQRVLHLSGGLLPGGHAQNISPIWCPGGSLARCPNHLNSKQMDELHTLSLRETPATFRRKQFNYFSRV